MRNRWKVPNSSATESRNAWRGSRTADSNVALLASQKSRLLFAASLSKKSSPSAGKPRKSATVPACTIAATGRVGEPVFANYRSRAVGIVDEDIAAVRSATDLVAIVSQYTQ